MNTYTHDIPIKEAVGLLKKLQFVVVDNQGDYTFVSSMDFSYSWLCADGDTTVVPLAEDGMAMYFSSLSVAKDSAIKHAQTKAS